MNFVNKVRRFLLVPSKTFEESKGDSLKEALKYYIRLAAINSAFLALWSTYRNYLIYYGQMYTKWMVFSILGVDFLDKMIRPLFQFHFNLYPSPQNDWNFYIYFIIHGIEAFIGFLTLLIISIFITGAIFHIFIHLVGGKKDITQTIKAFMYGQTPILLLGWIPIVNIIAGVWSLVLEIIGMRHFHEISTTKVIVAVLMLIIVTGIINAILQFLHIL